MGDGEDHGGIAAATADIIAQYQTTRVRALWTNYLRFVFPVYIYECYGHEILMLDIIFISGSFKSLRPVLLR